MERQSSSIAIFCVAIGDNFFNSHLYGYGGLLVRREKSGKRNGRKDGPRGRKYGAEKMEKRREIEEREVENRGEWKAERERVGTGI